MKGEEGLTAVELGQEVADALLAPSQQVENVQAPWIGERVEERRVPREAVGADVSGDHASIYQDMLIRASPPLHSGVPTREFPLDDSRAARDISPMTVSLNPTVPSAPSVGGQHHWRFFRAGGSDQVAFERADDLLRLADLDPKLWMALACPVRGLEFDERTLALMDTDRDGRIRVPEVLAAVSWACSLMKDPSVLLRGGDLMLDSINAESPEGARLLASARQILHSLGRGDARGIAVADTMETVKVFAQTRFNGDGVVPVESVDEGPDRAVAEAIVAAVGAVVDRSGKPGITQPTIDQFFADCDAYADWWAHTEREAAELLPLGARTIPALQAMQAVRGKVDDFFVRCRLAAFDGRAVEALNREVAEYVAIASNDLQRSAPEVAGFPLARIEAGRALPLTEALNPAWAAAMEEFRVRAVLPILGDRSALTESDWARIGATFAAHETWAAGKVGSSVEALGIARVSELARGRSRAALLSLVAQDAALAPEMDAIDNVERLARYQRDLVTLLNNFVAFRDFYARERPAVFQAGTLYLDGRSCDLCVRVDDAGKHAALAGLAKCYLAYCECTRTDGQTMTIAAAFTGGDSDNLMVGRNGVFYDRKGRDWDATITKVVENPISIRQAFWAPYKKLVRLIEEQVARRAAAGAAASDARVSVVATMATSIDSQRPAAPAKKIDVGTVAALGVAFGALATATAAIAGYLSGVLDNPFWQICIAFGGLILLISAPSMLIAWLKLRQRNLGPLLDASGWAVNGRVQMNVPFGGALTHEAQIPIGAESSFAVKYPETPTVMPKMVVAGLAAAFLLSLLLHYKVIGSGGMFDWGR